MTSESVHDLFPAWCFRSPRPVQRPMMCQAPKRDLTNITLIPHKYPLVKPDFLKRFTRKSQPKESVYLRDKNIETSTLLFMLLCTGLSPEATGKKWYSQTHGSMLLPGKFANCLTLKYGVGCFQSFYFYFSSTCLTLQLDIKRDFFLIKQKLTHHSKAIIL